MVCYKGTLPYPTLPYPTLPYPTLPYQVDHHFYHKYVLAVLNIALYNGNPVDEQGSALVTLPLTHTHPTPPHTCKDPLGGTPYH